MRRSAEEESTPPVKINLQSFEENEEEEDGDINRKKKVSSLDESFDPEEYITRFVTPEKKTAPLAKQKKATIDVPMDELEAISDRRRTKVITTTIMYRTRFLGFWRRRRIKPTKERIFTHTKNKGFRVSRGKF